MFFKTGFTWRSSLVAYSAAQINPSILPETKLQIEDNNIISNDSVLHHWTSDSDLKYDTKYKIVKELAVYHHVDSFTPAKALLRAQALFNETKQFSLL